MKFDFISIITNPFVLVFFTVSLGLMLGRIRFVKFNIGTSGTLFLGLIIGWGIYEFCAGIVEKGQDAAGYAAASKLIHDGVVTTFLFDFSLILFVAAVGLLAAKDILAVLKKYGGRFIILGLLITLVGALGTFGATYVIKDVNSYEVAGVYTGALTSSPGLGAALESTKLQATDYANNFGDQPVRVKKEILAMIDPSGSLSPDNTTFLTKEQQDAYILNAEAGVGVGHAIGYPFGVLIVIFAVNFLSGIFKIDVSEEKKRFALEMNELRKTDSGKQIPETPFSMISFSLTCLIGYIVGSVEIYLGPIGYFNLGATGGVLIMGLVLGYIGKIGPISFRIAPKALHIIRDIGLSLFLGIVGLKYGFRAFDALLESGIALALTSILVGTLAILVGFFVGRYVFKLNWILLVGAICGGMTSTPGLGAAVDAIGSDDPAAGYGATYPFALLGVILFSILLHKVPVF
ncbi:MAG TPA: hypothetical protein VFC96_00535 [Anaerovoracaceae bacterium]|nr:hypothetical protein [Anaerovoracaceae bacterium]